MLASILFPFSVLACLVLSATTAAAQAKNHLGEPPKPTTQKPAGPSTMIVRALTDAGQPVTDLKAEEITIRTDGRDRKVQGLELVSVASAAAPAAGPAPAKPASTLPAPFATNTAPPAGRGGGGGREFLIILDEEGIAVGREEPVRKAIGQLTAGASASDRFAMISLRQGGREVQPGPAAVLTDHLARFVGLGSQSEVASDMVCRSQRAMQTLGNALRTASAGRTIVLLSPGLMAKPKGIHEMLRVTQESLATPELCQIGSNDFDQLTEAAAASPANVYVVHYVDGLASAANYREAQQGIENIAGPASAELMRISGGSEPALRRILAETSSYYVATVEDAGAAGPTRRVEARTTRDGIKITARPAGRGAISAAAAPPKAGSPRDMIRVAAVFREVPLRATGLVSRTPGSQDLMVMALFEPEDPATKLTAAIVALFDDKGTLKAQWTVKANELGTYPVAAAVPVAAGTYRMRVAVSDAGGKGGTTDSTITVQLAEAGPVKLGSLVLGADQKSPKLLFQASDPQVIGFLPIYGVTKEMKISAVYEVRESETGAPLGTTDGNVLEMPGDARMLWGGFGLTPLAPGDYLMKVIVTVDGKEAGVVTRTLRKLQ